MFKKLFYLAFIIGVAVFVFLNRGQLVTNYHYLRQTPCDSPVEYRLGRIDSGYGLSEEAVSQKVGRAAAIWNEAVGRELIAYHPEAALVVNLIYTDRQSAFDRLENLEDRIDLGQKNLDAKISEYERLVADFNVRLERFNAEVAFWIERGGAPPPEYERLINEQETLKAEGDRLNSLARELDQSVQQYNTQIGEFNRDIADYNIAIKREPEAGLYDGSVPKIDIYLTASDLELIHTLAHEFGHALALDHLEDPEAIMYPFSSEDVTLSAEEISLLEVRCAYPRWQIIFDERVDNLKLIWQAFQSDYLQ